MIAPRPQRRLSRTLAAFTSGEVSPLLHSRVDLQAFASAASLIQGAFVRPQGAAAKRAGTLFAGKDASSSGLGTAGVASRLIPMVLDDANGYVIELYGGGLRIWYRGALVQDPATGQPIQITTPWTTQAALDNLSWVQVGAAIYFASSEAAPQVLTRSGHKSWSLAPYAMRQIIDPPTGLTISASDTTTTPIRRWAYVVTSIDKETGIESVASSEVSINAHLQQDDSNTHQIRITWSAVTGARAYNVYRSFESNQAFELLGEVEGTEYIDASRVQPLASKNPPKYEDPFDVADSSSWPTVVGYHGGRMVWGASAAKPSTIWLSSPGLLDVFMVSDPPADDDAMTIGLAGVRAERIRGFASLARLLILTSAGVRALGNPETGAIIVTDLPVTQGHIGAAAVQPLAVTDGALYVTETGRALRQLRYDLQTDLYGGPDLLARAPHLVTGDPIAEMTYARDPDGIVYARTEKGAVLMLAYQPEHEIFAWSRFGSSGTVRSICAVPEGGDHDRLYLVVERTVNGSAVRHIETSVYDDEYDAEATPWLDDALLYDGRNVGSTTMTITGPTWQAGDNVTIRASASTFSSSDVGRQVVFTGVSPWVRAEIVVVTRDIEVTARLERDVPASLQNVATTVWALASKTFAGLDHLEGLTVSSRIDGDTGPQATVSGGSVTLDRHAVRAAVGLPYSAVIRTLDLALVVGATQQWNVPRIYLDLIGSRAVLAGPKDSTLQPVTPARPGMDPPRPSETGRVQFRVSPRERRTMILEVRSDEPQPLTLAAITPEVQVAG